MSGLPPAIDLPLIRPAAHLLHVEDSETHRDILVAVIRRSGRNIIITAAESLREALDLLDRENFDVVLLDLELPDSSGIETVRAIQSKCPYIPIVILTGEEDPNVLAKVHQAGAFQTLNKAIDYRSLMNAIIVAIDNSQQAVYVEAQVGESKMLRARSVAQSLRERSERVRAALESSSLESLELTDSLVDLPISSPVNSPNSPIDA